MGYLQKSKEAVTAGTEQVRWRVKGREDECKSFRAGVDSLNSLKSQM